MGTKNENKTVLIPSDLPKDQLVFQAHENEQKMLQYQKEHDKKTVSRRDFMSAGLISFAGTAMSQSVFSMLMPRTAKADVVCSVNGGTTWLPLITVNNAGGANLSSHVIPLDANGLMLSSYSKSGWGSTANFSVDQEFSNKVPFFKGSSMLTGLRSTASTAALGASTLVSMPLVSQDDTATNHLNITGLVQAMGMKGSLLPNMGTQNTSTGDNTLSYYATAGAPLVVSGYPSITGALSVGGSLAPFVSTGVAGNLFNTIQKLSSYQSQAFVKLNDGALLQNLITCRTQDNSSLISGSGSASTDPIKNAMVAKNFALAANTSTSSTAYIQAALVHNALNGNSGPVTMSMGGYDYHNQTRTTGDAMDMSTGVLLGRIIQTAFDLGKTAMILLTTDGSTTSADSQLSGSPWVSDGGVRSNMYMIAVNPKQAPTVVKSQVGAYTAGQAADNTLISAPEMAAAAAFVNYLSLNNQLSNIGTALPSILSAQQIKAMTAFQAA